MLKRCYSGANCKWGHPPPDVRKRLWEDHTAAQEELDRKGISVPQNPNKKKEQDPLQATRQVNLAGQYGPHNVPPPPPLPPLETLSDKFKSMIGDWREQREEHGLTRAVPPTNHPVRSDEGDQSGPYGPDNVPPPPSFPPPKPSYDMLQGVHGEPRIPHFEEQSGPHPSYAGLPGFGKKVSAPRSEVEKEESPEVSMLDAPPSPKGAKGGNKFQPTGNANREPLGKVNRLQDEASDMDLEAGTWTGAKMNRREPKQTLEAQAQTGHERRGSSLLTSDVPSPAATTLWKRSVASFDAPMTDDEGVPRVGGYWERLRERQEALKKEKDEKDVPEADEFVFKKPALPKVMAAGEAVHTSLLASQLISAPTTSLSLAIMGATKRLANGEIKHVGPHPSTMRVSALYMSQAAIEKRLQPPTQQGQFEVQERSLAEAREDTFRLQGCTWLDNVRRALQLPIRTYTTACVYYHKFRLAHPGNLTGMEYGNAWADACAASLLTSCKVEDTLKKSRDILAAAYNLKAPGHDQLGSDDAVFEGPSRNVIGLERLVLEAGGFDFRSKYPHKLLVKIAKSMPEGIDGEREKVTKVAWTILTDLHRTFAPIKQTSATMALASLELSAHLCAMTSPNNTSAIRDELQQYNVAVWSTSREEIMETLLDLLDLYTQHTANSILGTKYSLDHFLRIRLALNKECSESNIQRYTIAPATGRPRNESTLRVTNGHPTPVSPPQPTVPQQSTNGTQPSPIPEDGGTLRFILNPQMAANEKKEVQKYFVEEWEEYEEEIEVPLPRPTSSERDRRSTDRPNDGACSERSDRDGARGRDERGREKEKERLRDHERERERERERDIARERARMRDRERDRRDHDRRYDNRDRRYDDRRDRRYEDDRRRR